MTSDTLADTLQSVSQSQSAWPTVLAVLCVIMACLSVYNAANAGE